jgi:hypothetical protein
MSLIVPGLGKTITPKRRRLSPKTKIIGRGKVTANPYVTDNKPRPKLGSKPRGGKVTPPSGVVNDKPRPKSGGRAIPRPPRMEKPSPRPVKPKIPTAAKPASSGGVKRRPRPAAAGAANKPKQPVRAPTNRRITASGKRFGGRPSPIKANSGKKYAAPGGSAPSRPSRKKSTFGKKYEGPLRPGIRPSRPSRATAPVKRYGYGKRPMGLLSRRPRGRR